VPPTPSTPGDEQDLPAADGAWDGLLTGTLLLLADALRPGYDEIDACALLCDRVLELFHADVAGVLLAEAQGTRLLAVTRDAPEVIALFDGTDADAPWTGAPPAAAVLTGLSDGDPWSAAVVAAGYASAVVVPLRVRDRRLGVLGLLLTAAGGLGKEEVNAVQALADAAALGLMSRRELREATEAAQRLRASLERTAILERARGMLVAALGVDLDAARAVLDRLAQTDGWAPEDVAAGIVGGELDVVTLLEADLEPPAPATR